VKHIFKVSWRSKAMGWTSRVWFSVGAEIFCFHHHIQIGSEAHPASYSMSTGGSFPGGKVAGARRWPLTPI